MTITAEVVTVKSIRDMADIAKACGDCHMSEATLLEIARKLELLADRNVSGLALQKEWQQRAEKAEAELAALAAQKPSVMVVGKLGAGIRGVCISGSPRPDVGAELFTRAAPAGVVVPDEAAAFEAWRYSDRNISITLADDVYRGVAISAFKAGMAAVIEANKKAGE